MIVTVRIPLLLVFHKWHRKHTGTLASLPAGQPRRVKDPGLPDLHQFYEERSQMIGVREDHSLALVGSDLLGNSWVKSGCAAVRGHESAASSESRGKSTMSEEARLLR